MYRHWLWFKGYLLYSAAVVSMSLSIIHSDAAAKDRGGYDAVSIYAILHRSAKRKEGCTR